MGEKGKKGRKREKKREKEEVYSYVWESVTCNMRTCTVLQIDHIGKFIMKKIENIGNTGYRQFSNKCE